jgi:hypothetical protein
MKVKVHFLQLKISTLHIWYILVLKNTLLLLVCEMSMIEKHQANPCGMDAYQ